MTLPVSVIVKAYNEEENIVNVMQGFDDKIVLDNGSTDRTKMLAERIGARVYDISDMYWETATSADVKKYKKLLDGQEPMFKCGDRFQSSGKCRQYGVQFAKYDWCYFPDGDEFTTITDEDEIIRLMGYNTRIQYNFVHARDENGVPRMEFVNPKFANMKYHYWKWDIHEVIGVKDEWKDNPILKEEFTTAMEVDHKQRYKEHRGNARIAAVEFWAVRHPDENDGRPWHYIGAEYDFYDMPEKSINPFTLAIQKGQFVPEKAQSLMLLSWNLPDDHVQKLEIMYNALRLDPTRRDIWVSLADMYWMVYHDPYPALAFLYGALHTPNMDYRFASDRDLFQGGIERRINTIANVIRSVAEELKAEDKDGGDG